MQRSMQHRFRAQYLVNFATWVAPFPLEVYFGLIRGGLLGCSLGILSERLPPYIHPTQEAQKRTTLTLCLQGLHNGSWAVVRGLYVPESRPLTIAPLNLNLET